MRVTLELIRIIVILGLLGTFGWFVIENIYTVNETTKKYSWLAALAILILLFVLYRNKLQFSGWYKGKGRKILPRKVSVVLISLSVILVITPFILSSLLGYRARLWNDIQSYIIVHLAVFYWFKLLVI